MSAPRTALLVSPGPVDGYPPVQYQARLLADAGYRVELVTLTLPPRTNGADFAHPGVRVTCLPGWLAVPGRTALRTAALAAAVAAARHRLGGPGVEIAYDPLGVWISDLAPGRSRRRVAHFHELLQHDDRHVERRLTRAIAGFDLVVVPDEARARHTRDKLGLTSEPLVIENLPLRAATAPRCRTGEADAGFEVVYCGSLGLDQKLDAVIRSVHAWPDTARLLLIGRDDTTAGRGLKALTAELGLQGRVSFAGWLPLPAAEARMAQSHLAIALLDSGSEQWRTALGASNKRYQYMKAGLPQIGDRNPGVPDLIEGQGIGACVPEAEPDRIAALVHTYATAPARCRAEGERAFALHLSRYNYERAFQPLLDRIDAS